MNLLISLTNAEKKKIRAAVEKELTKYRLYKTSSNIQLESKITNSYEARYHVPTGQTIDQTSNVAVHNVDQQKKKIELCERVEQAVAMLPTPERFLIEERYTSADSEYTTDLQVYCYRFDPPLSHVTYATIRNKAMLRLALSLDIECGVDLSQFK